MGFSDGKISKIKLCMEELLADRTVVTPLENGCFEYDIYIRAFCTGKRAKK